MAQFRPNFTLLREQITLEELEQMIVSTREDLHSRKIAMGETRRQIAELKGLQSYSRQFLTNKKVYREYYSILRGYHV